MDVTLPDDADDDGGVEVDGDERARRAAAGGGYDTTFCFAPSLFPRTIFVG